MLKYLIKKKIKGGILLYAVFISVIISVFCGSVLLLVYYLNYNTQKFFITESLKDEAESALIMALYKNEYINDEFVLQEKYKTKTKSFPWGIYSILHVSSKYGSDTINRVILVGNAMEEFENSALFLSDPTQDLSICGNVVLRGTCHLPNSKIKKVSIEGRSIEKQDISFDRINTSMVAFPVIKEESYYPVKQYLLQNNKTNFNNIDIILKNDSLINSFSNETKFFYSNSNINIKNKKLYGNIVIISDNEIYIEDCDIKDIVIVSEKITISNVQNSSLQAYALNEIIVNNNSELSYPSSIVVYNNKEVNNNINVTIKDNSHIKGSVILKSEYEKNAKILLDRGSVIEGIIYSTAYVELKGNVYGCVFCSKLYYKTKNNSYKNLLMDAVLNADLLSDHFMGPDFSSGSLKKGIVKCLN